MNAHLAPNIEFDAREIYKILSDFLTEITKVQRGCLFSKYLHSVYRLRGIIETPFHCPHNHFIRTDGIICFAKIDAIIEPTEKFLTYKPKETALLCGFLTFYIFLSKSCIGRGGFKCRKGIRNKNRVGSVASGKDRTDKRRRHH